MADYGPVPNRGIPPRAGTYGAQSSRDAAFSDIFGAAPSGRSQTMTGANGQYPSQQERSATMTSASQANLYPQPHMVPRQMQARQSQPNGYGAPVQNGYPPQQRMPSGPPPQQPPAQYLPQPLSMARRPIPQPQRVDQRDPRQGAPMGYGRTGPLPNRGPMQAGPGPALNNDAYRSRSMAGIPSGGLGGYGQAQSTAFRPQQQQQQFQNPASRTTAQGRVVPERHDERAMSMTSYNAEPTHANQTMSGRIIPHHNVQTNRRRESDATLTDDRSDTTSHTYTSQYQQRAVSQPGMGGQRTMSMASTMSVDVGNRTSSLVHRPSLGKINNSNGSSGTFTRSRGPVVYPALLSRVSKVFMENIEPRERQKNGLTYQNAFSGKEAVDLISYIIRTSDRNLALLLGRALDAQKFFHDVTYEHRLRDSSAETYQFDETQQLEDPTSKINGVFTLLTECYSPTCTRDNLCYSIACPRRLEQQQRLNMKPQPGLQRQISAESLHADDNEEQKLWINTVSKEVADSVDEKEKKRQEVISELMYTERDFVKDLEYLRDFWIKPLRLHTPGHTPIIPEARRELVLRTIFANVMDVHNVNYGLAGALTKRQQENPVVGQIGDVFLQFVSRFEPFIRYGASQLYGKWEFEAEKQRNHIFARFVEEVERMKESRKLELNGYLTKPTTRLARYPLLLENVLKYTAEGNPDRENIPKVITVIRDFLTRVNKESGKAENQFNLLQLDANLRWDPTTAVDLKLKEEGREIIFKCGLKKSLADSGEITVYVFDHAVLLVKAKQEKKTEQLRVYRRPITLELLEIAQMDEVIKRPASALNTLNPLANRGAAAAQAGKEGFPITFKNLGRHTYEITLYATSQTMRQKLMQHIETQQTKLFNRNKPYVQTILNSGFFSGFNKVNCMVPTDGGRKLIYGTDQGIFVSERRRTGENRPRRALELRNVTQLDVLEEYQLLLVLADKTLYSYSLDVLAPGEVSPHLRRPQRLQGHANFFRAGVCVGRHLVCSAKSSGLSTTVKVFEPMENNTRRNRGFLATAFGGGAPEQLRPFKEYYIPTESYSIHFLKTKLCVATIKGFEIVSLEAETQSLLDQADTSLDFVVRDARDVRPIHVERLNGEFLLNYSDFSFFVNRNGWRARHDWRIDWEGRPESFALSYPHIIAFEPNFIEIRHVETAVCENILTAKNIRMLHASTREIIYAYDDEGAADIIASLDFWSRAEQHNNRDPVANGNRA